MLKLTWDHAAASVCTYVLVDEGAACEEVETFVAYTVRILSTFPGGCCLR